MPPMFPNKCNTPQMLLKTRGALWRCWSMTMPNSGRFCIILTQYSVACAKRRTCLHLPLFAIAFHSHPPLYHSPAANPSTASIDSNASSNSSTTYQFNALSMNSPSGANPQPQVAGPSGLGQASSPQEGKSFTHSQTSKAVLSIMRTLQTLE